MSVTRLAALLAPGGAPLVVVAAHPDDDVVGAGALLARARDAHVVHVTDGAPADGADARAAGCGTPAEYAALRRREALAALALAGMAPERVHALGVPDQRACEHAAEIAHRLHALLAGLRPAAVVTHAYEGGHPDHDATALAVQLAFELAAGAFPVIEMSSYHRGPAGFRAGEFLPAPGAVLELRLAPDEQERKRRMLACHASQAHILARFAPELERFRAAAAPDFERPPHPGRLLYEDESFGMDPARFRELALEARARCRAGEGAARCA